MIFSHVTPSHSGIYTCHGGPGVNQSVEVVVEFPPLVSLDQSYQHRARGGSSLELVCTVEAVPAARVEWWRSGMSLAGLGEVGGRAKVEYREPGRHLLTLDNPTEEDLGVYSCSANNTEGEARATIDVSGAGQETMLSDIDCKCIRGCSTPYTFAIKRPGVAGAVSQTPSSCIN